MAEKKGKKEDKKTEKASAKKAARPAGKKGGGLLVKIILGLAAVFFLPATLVALCGMVPALVMLATDRSRGKNLAVGVGALNATGVVHMLITLARKGVTMDYAVQLLREPANWLVMWGGAGIGYMIFTMVPPVVAQVLALMADMKIQKLKANQQELAKIWSEKVKGS